MSAQDDEVLAIAERIGRGGRRDLTHRRDCLIFLAPPEGGRCECGAEAAALRAAGRGPGRRIRLTPASTIKPKPVLWTWQDRAPVGEVVLTPGRGGVGKSTFHTWLIAQLTRGQLPGIHDGTPSACIIAAAEDSWERTIVPRLIAAGADLTLVFRAGIITTGDEETSLTLPEDCAALETEIRRSGAVLLSVDPLMSTIAAGLDTHKDREVRTALEPLGRLADRTGCTVLGNAHFNKSSTADPVSLITGSAAFSNVARAALGFVVDPETDNVVITQIKNNLGRLDLPSLSYRIDSAVIETDDGPADVGRLVMLGESDRSVHDLLRDRDGDERSERDEAVEWLTKWLIDQGGEAIARDALKAAAADGIVKTTLHRARKRAGVTSTKDGFGGPWIWRLDPPRFHEDSQDSRSQKLESMEPSVESSGDAGPDELHRCPVCSTPTTPSSTGHPSLCRRCTKSELDTRTDATKKGESA